MLTALIVGACFTGWLFTARYALKGLLKEHRGKSYCHGWLGLGSRYNCQSYHAGQCWRSDGDDTPRSPADLRLAMLWGLAFPIVPLAILYRALTWTLSGVTPLVEPELEMKRRRLEKQAEEAEATYKAALRIVKDYGADKLVEAEAAKKESTAVQEAFDRQLKMMNAAMRESKEGSTAKNAVKH